MLARPAGRYAQAVFFVALAFALRLSLTPWVGNRAALTLTYPAVLIAAWLGGVGPGILAVALSVAVSTFLMEPFGPFAARYRSEWWSVGLYVATACSIAIAAGSARRARSATHREIERTREILDQMTVGFVVIDRSFRFVFLNAKGLELAGKSHEEIIGADARQLFGEAKVAMEKIARVLAHGESHEYEVYYPPYDRWYLQRAFPVREGAAVFIVDITESKRDQEAINQSRELLTRALAAAHMGYWSWDIPSGRVSWSDNLEQVHALPENSVGGSLEAFLELVHSQDRPGVEAAMRRALAEGTSYALEFRIVRPDGGIEWIAGRGEVEMRDGKAVRMTGLGSNVTARKKAEEEQRLLAAIVSSSEDAIVSKALDGTITSWNRAAERIFGYGADEAVGKSIKLIFPPEKEDDFLTILDRVRRGERVEHYETLRKTKDGRIIEVALTVSPVHDERGDIVGASKIARDVTALKAAERERQRTRDMYLGILGHDLRNPLNTIVASLYTLDRVLTDDARKVLARMARSTQRMSRMIEQLLDFTRARLGDGIMLTLASGDLRDISHAVVEELEAQHPHRIRFEGKSVPGRFDSDRLAQAVANLVGNALQHGSPGEPVEVRVSSNNGHGRLEVENRGAPIPEAIKATIFEPFRRAEGRQDSTGLGLGLFIAREIVRAHGGTIEVDSTGDRTTFAIELPSQKPTA